MVSDQLAAEVSVKEKMKKDASREVPFQRASEKACLEGNERRKNSMPFQTPFEKAFLANDLCREILFERPSEKVCSKIDPG